MKKSRKAKMTKKEMAQKKEQLAELYAQSLKDCKEYFKTKKVLIAEKRKNKKS
jgi:hypothetical protein